MKKPLELHNVPERLAELRQTQIPATIGPHRAVAETAIEALQIAEELAKRLTFVQSGLAKMMTALAKAQQEHRLDGLLAHNELARASQQALELYTLAEAGHRVTPETNRSETHA